MAVIVATLLPNAKQQFWAPNGVPLAGGSVYFYIPNTSTPKTTWQDSGQVVANTNPVILDANGQAIIYGEGVYRQVVFDNLNNLIWDQLTQSTDYGLLEAGNNLSDVTDPAQALANIGGISAASANNILPVGTLIMFASTTVPTTWLVADGSAISRVTYQVLFNVIGTVFGNGDGFTTFNLPDFRGQFARGWDDGAGVDPGRAFGSPQSDAFDSHTHTATITDPGHVHGVPFSNGGSGPIFIQEIAGGGLQSLQPSDSSPTGISVVNTSTGGTETRPKNVAILICIKALPTT